MKRLVPAIFAACMLGWAGSASALTTIDFSLAPTSFTSYSEGPVTFTSVTGSLVYAVEGPNFTNNLIGEYEAGYIPLLRADFALDVGLVSVELGDYADDADLLYLEVFDFSGVSLGSTTLLTDESFEGMETLSITASGIRFAIFGALPPAGIGSSVYADNFTYGLSAVPEPATWAMMITGFGLVGGAMRRRVATQIA
ncbi:PEPxxWA-CTERM sorting domain-containing protein [Phenylobacterium sp.]|uniref:PEPxxWA-CTERM sorting domain-containing protein n=1 Tax=Phenylobacterium sp. TaxID=1871053 RepID=UPI00273326B3|nr:PEPxxWA-CTERM sorting domain-containing protein [Phenylobacterium sp.]MDP3855377.1 PEPxxWA-CTERM sorting domain-containing protein [Phenylobacterium sp.]